MAQGLAPTPASFVASAVLPYALGGPCVKGHRAPLTAAGVTTCSSIRLGLTNRLVLLPGELRKVWMSPALRKDVGSGLSCFTPRAAQSWL